MAVVVTKTDSKTKEKSYPKLMISNTNGIIVLMLAYGVGVRVSSGNDLLSVAGSYSTSWSMGQFVDYEGTVTLTNE